MLYQLSYRGSRLPYSKAALALQRKGLEAFGRLIMTLRLCVPRPIFWRMATRLEGG
jgi:hypothetical protein